MYNHKCQHLFSQQLQVQICKFTKQSSFEHGKPQAALNATAAFFWGVGCFPLTNKPMKLKLFWILVVFCFSSHDTIPSSRSFLSFHFCEGNELHPGSHQKGFKGPRKAVFSTKQGVAICEFKSHPNSNLFQDNIYLYLFQTLAPSISTVLLLECTIVSGMSEDPGTKEHPTYLCLGDAPNSYYIRLESSLESVNGLVGYVYSLNNRDLLLKQQFTKKLQPSITTRNITCLRCLVGNPMATVTGLGG